MRVGRALLRHAALALGRAVPVLAGVSVLVFLLVHAIPGDPAVIAAGLEASPETVARIRQELGLDRPLPEQFGRFVARTARGDLGVSIRTGVPVAHEIADRMPHSVRLAVLSILVAAVAGVAIGVLAAVARGSWFDQAVMTLTLVAVSTPSFWLALMLMLVFSLWLGLLPAIGTGTARHDVLPVATLGLQATGLVARMTRAAMGDVLQEDFVRAARAKGASRARAVLRHALAAALVPIVTIVGLRFGGLLAGTVLVESVFAIPGVGRLMVDAVVARDFPVIQGGVLVVAALFVAVNAFTDALAPVLDPRVGA
jgi:ABC-type dipeptide/oligopeptide/nickel transport system permease component